jgi:uncharacterized protein
MLQSLYTPNCLRTFTGQFINITQPDIETIYAFDIAIGLSRAFRFAGHTRKPYSVAEHSIWCAEKAEEMHPDKPGLAFKLLLHDAHEFLLCDFGSPFKKLLEEYEHYASILQDAVHERYNVRISNSDQSIISEIDKMALEWEWENKVLRWTGLELNDRARIDLFIHHFVRLCKTPHILQPA